MDATKTLSFTSAEYHMLKLAARGEGKKPEEFLASLLTRFFRAMADLQGIECPVTVTPEHIHRPGLTHPAAVTEPPTQPRPAAPVAEERTRLIRPGMTIPAGDVDPEDESLYI